MVYKPGNREIREGLEFLNTFLPLDIRPISEVYTDRYIFHSIFILHGSYRFRCRKSYLDPVLFPVVKWKIANIVEKELQSPLPKHSLNTCWTDMGDITLTEEDIGGYDLYKTFGCG